MNYIFVGKFDPPHYGHLGAIKEGIKKATDSEYTLSRFSSSEEDNLLICIGSANSHLSTAYQCLFNYKQRKDFLSLWLHLIGVYGYTIVPLPDMNNLDLWLDLINDLYESHFKHWNMKENCTFISGLEDDISFFAEKGFKTEILIPRNEGKLYNSTSIRKVLLDKTLSDNEKFESICNSIDVFIAEKVMEEYNKIIGDINE